VNATNGCGSVCAVATVTVNVLLLVAVPPGVVTVMGPVVAPLGTVASIIVAELTVKLALVPLMVTAVAPLNPVPLIVTLVPAVPLVGVKLLIAGALATVIVTGVDVEALPASSRARAVSVWAPSVAVVVSQRTE